MKITTVHKFLLTNVETTTEEIGRTFSVCDRSKWWSRHVDVPPTVVAPHNIKRRTDIGVSTITDVMDTMSKILQK